MSRGTSVKPYRRLAEYYDDFFSGARPPMEAARERFLGPILPAVESACDLACGTGTTALFLARLGIETYAVDLSPAMCRAAREKVRRAGLPVRVIEADMRSFRLPTPVDLITCEFDALNHVPRKEDLRRVVNSVSHALRSGGHFFFDVNNARGFQCYWSGTVWFEKPGVAVAMRNAHDPHADRAWSDVEWFVRNGKLWRRYHERVEEVCWTGAEIRGALEEAGFDRVRAWDAAPFFPEHPLMRRGCHTIYLARKARA